MARTPPLPPHSPATLPPPSPTPVLRQLPQSLWDPRLEHPGLLGVWAMSHHTSPCCAVALGSRACRLLQDSSKGSGAQRRQRQTRWDRQTLLTPALISKTICSARRRPRRALGQKEPAPGWPCAGLRGLPSQEARLAFPLQLPALASL